MMAESIDFACLENIWCLALLTQSLIFLLYLELVNLPICQSGVHFENRSFAYVSELLHMAEKKIGKCDPLTKCQFILYVPYLQGSRLFKQKTLLRQGHTEQYFPSVLICLDHVIEP